MYKVSLMKCFVAVSALSLCAGCASAPIALWHMDEISGGTIIDSAGSNNGIARADLPLVDGVKGKAVQLNGAADSYIAFSSTLNVTDKMTVETWVNPGFDVADINQYPGWPGGREIVRKASNYIDCFYLAVVGRYRPEPFLEFTIYYANGHYFNLTHNIDGMLQKGKWTHLVGTFKRNDHVRLYVDGVKVAEAPTEDSPIRSCPKRLVIGQVADVAGEETYFDHTSTWIGLIDETAIYDQALTENEVKQHYKMMQK